MKRIFTLFTFLFPLFSMAQVRYRDLVVALPALSREQQKTELKEFLLTDLDHPNANFRLAMIYETNYKTTDPLASYGFAMANAEQARIRFFKSKQVVDEREVNRNNEYYGPIFKIVNAKGNFEVPFQNVLNKMNGGYDSAELFLKKMPAIFTSFTKSVNHYDRAVKLFSDLTLQYQSPEDLYLMHDAALDQKLTDLKSNYDSCIRFFDHYLSLIRDYPIRGHRQTYTVKAIETYRLDGLLTRLNFLIDQVELWNYGAWVDATRKMMSTEITSLRQSILKNNAAIDETLAKIDISPADQLPKPVPLDKQLIYNLNHFDRQSMVLALLDYKSFKQVWNIQNRGKVLDTTFSEHNAEVFSNLIYSNRKADSLMKELKLRIKPRQLSKHQDYLTKTFGGQPGLEKYASAEQQHIQQSFEQYTKELRENLVNINPAGESFTNKDNLIKSGRFSVPLIVQPATAEGLDQGILFTLFNKKNPDASAYVAGIYKPDKKKNLVSTFVVRINPDGRVAWFKDFAVSVDTTVVGDAHTYLGPVVLTQEGCAFVTRSVHSARGDMANTFIYINEKGEQKMKVRLNENGYPRFINYVEKNNAFVLALKGAEEKQNYSLSENLVLMNINVLRETVWRKEIAFTGTLTDLVSLADGYLVVGNYMILRDPSGKEFRTKVGAGECSPFLIKVSDQGEFVHIKPFETPQSVFVQRVVKINDNSVNLLGYSERLDVALIKTFTDSDKPAHIMTNRHAQIVCTSY